MFVGATSWLSRACRLSIGACEGVISCGGRVHFQACFFVYTDSSVLLDCGMNMMVLLWSAFKCTGNCYGMTYTEYDHLGKGVPITTFEMITTSLLLLPGATQTLGLGAANVFDVAVGRLERMELEAGGILTAKYSTSILRGEVVNESESVSSPRSHYCCEDRRLRFVSARFFVPRGLSTGLLLVSVSDELRSYPVGGYWCTALPSGLWDFFPMALRHFFESLLRPYLEVTCSNPWCFATGVGFHHTPMHTDVLLAFLRSCSLPLRLHLSSGIFVHHHGMGAVTLGFCQE